MDKQELIHTHALFAEIRAFAQKTDGFAVDTPEYDALNVEPIALTATANDHEEAVFTLAGELSESLTVRESVERDAPMLAAD